MQEQEKIETKEENKAKVENAKREYYAKTLKNKRIVRALKGCVYAVTTVMLALGLLTFIVVFCLDKHWINSNITIPIIFMLFGLDAVLLTLINGRISRTNNTKGDILEFIIGIASIILVFIWLLMSLAE